MRKEFNFVKATIGFILGFSLVFVCCSKKEDGASSSSNNSQATGGGANGNITVSYLQQSHWKVSYLNSNGKDETGKLSGYVLAFKGDGTVAAMKGGASLPGTWAYRYDDNKYKLIMNFGEGEPFRELNNDWEIMNTSTFNIRLQDVSGGNGGTDFLTLEAI